MDLKTISSLKLQLAAVIWLAVPVCTLPRCGSPRGVPTGTYEWEIRIQPCFYDKGEVLRGFLVLEEEEFRYIDLPRDVYSYFRDDYDRNMRAYYGWPNGCFTLGEIDGSNPPQARLTRWEVDKPGWTRLSLFHGIDAGHLVEITFSNEGVRGTAQRWHAPEGATCPPDPITARRVSEVDRGRCIAAAREHIEWLRRQPSD